MLNSPAKAEPRQVRSASDVAVRSRSAQRARRFLKIGDGTRDMTDLQQVKCKPHQCALLISLSPHVLRIRWHRAMQRVFVRQLTGVEQTPSERTGKFCLQQIIASMVLARASAVSNRACASDRIDVSDHK